MPAALRVEQSAHCFVLSGVGAGAVPFTYRVGRRAGELALRVRGELMVEEDSGLQLWRAPTDNDRANTLASIVTIDARGEAVVCPCPGARETAECRGRRLLGIVEDTILNNRTKVSYSAILWDFYSFYKTVLDG